MALDPLSFAALAMSGPLLGGQRSQADLAKAKLELQRQRKMAYVKARREHLRKENRK